MDAFHYVYIFLQSNLIEIPVYYIFYRRLAGLGRISGFVTLSNSITHPVVFFGLMAMNRSYLESILVAEAFAIVAEALLHRWFLRDVPAGLTWKASAAANLLSWQLAPLFTYWVLLLVA